MKADNQSILRALRVIMLALGLILIAFAPEATAQKCDPPCCDSLTFYRNHYLKTKDQQALSVDNFIKIYKYERLYKYYMICMKKPSQWKYYKGWSKRVFEQ
jgi:hypothetical protein